ncbi:hypothetical protein NCLIV_061600 [Neospora caninum Liverpool]|uniref:phosphoserine transaminase n=1 Tax=Neospora caninum (strain Liverpool) TaxID=572307 RepID=F0VPT8_NEOCL|nr:hypothetical protein NCLIV_061600 [Neospora caninum Liverpool]CBZ55735.1 hypothetical protein NCLIV_061600 [Neospora caninum Liverpool]CEL70477.1 TPA: Phosphoserine aminotransferase [Neospora caninum Liverpool]|eukprot:XP_003885761.1 hypothetical protein NCLIV_061600 [Neospora caninum Liverpool]
MADDELASLAATKRQQILPYGRVVNFAPGPACLPVEVLLEAQQDFLNWRGCGMSILEMSHRGRYYLKMLEETKGHLAALLNLPPSHHLLFMQGGATLQFAAQPLNMLRASGDTADYVITGNWSRYAFKEAGKYGNMRVAADNKANGSVDLPAVTEWSLNPNAAYVHYCDNETVYGLEFPQTPDLSQARFLPPTELPLFSSSSPSSPGPGDAGANGSAEGSNGNGGEKSPAEYSAKTKLRLTSDMSSNFCSRPIDIEAHALIVAGAQKNVGPSGVTIVIARDDVLGKELDLCPSMCSYSLCKKADSALNTPPVFSIYIVGLMAKYLRKQGGLASWADVCARKAKKIYDVIDESDVFLCPVAEGARSRMNIRFSVVDPSHREEHEAREGATKTAREQAPEHVELTRKFLREAEERGLYHLEGHRALGGCRASLYTGMPMEGVDALVQFMKEFAEENSDVSSPETKKSRQAA